VGRRDFSKKFAKKLLPNMRTKLILTAQSGFLPFNYGPYLCAAVYEKLGIEACVSGIHFKKGYNTVKNGFEFKNLEALMSVCTLSAHQIKFKRMTVHSTDFEVVGFEEEVLQVPESEITLSTLSPVCVVQKNDIGETDTYLNPKEPLFWDNLLDRAYSQYAKFFGQIDYDYSFSILNAKKRLVKTLSGISVIGHEFDAKIKTDPRLVNVLLHAGAGWHIINLKTPLPKK
jgi:CRISPR-associated endoribonuclease Cas6